MFKKFFKIFFLLFIFVSSSPCVEAVSFTDDKNAFKDLKPVIYKGKQVRKYIKQWVDEKSSYHKEVYYAYPGEGETEIKHGRYVDYYENGQARVLGEFENGRREGKFTTWAMNGKKIEEAFFIEGTQFGINVQWDDSGRKIKETVYIDDHQTQVRWWDKEKTLVADGLLKNNEKWEGTFPENIENKDAQITQWVINKYKNGKLQEQVGVIDSGIWW